MKRVRVNRVNDGVEAVKLEDRWAWARKKENVEL